MSATLIASFPDSETSSLAALTTGVGQRPQLVRVGESIAGKTVRIVEWNRVVLAEGDATCQIETFRSRVLATTSESRLDEVVAAPEGDITKAVRRVNATETRIDRSAIGRVLANPFEFLKATRIVPEQQNGAVVGIRLFGIRPDSLLGALGFENGDRLENINGFALGTPEQMMAAYGNLRSLEHLTVRLNRAGQTVNLDIEAR